MNVLSLCSGIGAIDLAVRLVCRARTVCYVEREAFAASVLVARMADQALDPAPIWSDLRSFDARAWAGAVDLVLAGYPCQPFSSAGKRAAELDPRYLWTQVRRVIDDSAAPLVFLENVRGHLSLGFSDVLADLAALGFDAEWGLFSAAEVGAPHKRERLFCLAYRRDHGCELLRSALHDDGGDAPGDVADGRDPEVAEPDGARREAAGSGSRLDDGGEPLARGGELVNASEPGLEGRGLGRELDRRSPWPPGPADTDGWGRWIDEAGPQPVLRRGVDGDAAWVDRADRLRALGNGVVPLAAAYAFRTLGARVIG